MRWRGDKRNTEKDGKKKLKTKEMKRDKPEGGGKEVRKAVRA